MLDTCRFQIVMALLTVKNDRPKLRTNIMTVIPRLVSELGSMALVSGAIIRLACVVAYCRAFHIISIITAG